MANARQAKAKFVVKKGPTGKFRCNLVAANGEIIASSEAYTTKASALKGIDSVRNSALTAEIEDRTVAVKKAPGKINREGVALRRVDGRGGTYRARQTLPPRERAPRKTE